jgi:transketolase
MSVAIESPITRVQQDADRSNMDRLSINTIRTLAMDGVQAADSGHPGTPMAMAPVA